MVPNNRLLPCNAVNWERALNFTRLRLNGFKSFVDPSELEILPGLTGIVGPNGCGKSNLLDALRWVMGESRPTSMTVSYTHLKLPTKRIV